MPIGLTSLALRAKSKLPGRVECNANPYLTYCANADISQLNGWKLAGVPEETEANWMCMKRCRVGFRLLSFQCSL